MEWRRGDSQQRWHSICYKEENFGHRRRESNMEDQVSSEKWLHRPHLKKQNPTLEKTSWGRRHTEGKIFENQSIRPWKLPRVSPAVQNFEIEEPPTVGQSEGIGDQGVVLFQSKRVLDIFIQEKTSFCQQEGHPPRESPWSHSHGPDSGKSWHFLSQN